ncbi:elongation factor P 5-aminopentanone reductase [Marininema halotolerans]|uniref:3-oxoacyl-[acyl-carrier protein] reductase n=1 Tax=Marininema halotolerans TaxID=1155944 RepID=A0A1I6R5U0_9BACL|nr:3-oxoacyl-ACP reductase FabG [Marininema halotolerans]SFS60055.1 3-oxoacyl-[acyl-carrier protein] reductase [Marininema halotolerans]
MKKWLQGETALVSGGSRGIGAAIALELASNGADVAINYLERSVEAERVAKACQREGVSAKAYPADVGNRQEVNAMLTQVEKEFGEVSLLIHSAGVTGKSLLFQDVVDEEMDLLFNTHVRGAMHLVQGGMPGMIRRQQGRIILISSIWGEAGGAGEVLYSAAKGAMNGLTRALAKELAPSGITVNAIAPGAIETDMLLDQLSKEEIEELTESIPIGRVGKPAEVAHLVAHVCRKESAYLTGQILHVNGGWYP